MMDRNGRQGTERRSVLLSAETLREWATSRRKEAVRYGLDSRIRGFLWDMSTVIAEHLPDERKQGN